MATSSRFLKPFIIPVYFFALVILTGAALLYAPFSHAESLAEPLKFIDALFISTSAACVTGLATVDVSQVFNRTGHTVLIFLMQIGGLGIMTFSSLLFYLWRRKTTLSDLVAVGRSMRTDHSFSLGGFLVRLFIMVFSLELIGAVIIRLAHPEIFSNFEAVFLAVSAFCNAGFALFPENLTQFQADPAVNLVVMFLIIFGGLGFAVLLELWDKLKALAGRRRAERLTWSTYIVVSSTLFLILGGALVLMIGAAHRDELPWVNRVWISFFQSVTCRTAGFNTVPIDHLSDFALAFMCLLMFIGAAPASTGGGIKVTTARALAAHALALFRGGRQARVRNRAVDAKTLQTALALAMIAGAVVFISTIALCISEGGFQPHTQAQGRFMEAMFEVISAFGTVGLTVGLTPNLTIFGKGLIIGLMFVGRLGPLVLIAAIGEMRKPQYYSLPEDSLMIG